MSTKGASEVFQMAGITGGKDEKGIVSYVVPYFCPKDKDPADVDCTKPESLGSTYDIKEHARSWRDNGDGSFTIYVTFEGGLESDPKGNPQQWFQGDDGSYELSGSMKDIPIEQHPGISGLMKKYHGSKGANGVVEFQVGTADNPNPMFGCRTFKCASATLRRTIIKSSVDSDIFENVGNTVSKIGNFPSITYKAPDGEGGTKDVPREFMVLAPTITKRGSKFTITQEYMMAPKGGFPQYMYDLVQT